MRHIALACMKNGSHFFANHYFYFCQLIFIREGNQMEKTVLQFFKIPERKLAKY